jgi:hypothetical protein
MSAGTVMRMNAPGWAARISDHFFGQMVQGVNRLIQVADIGGENGLFVGAKVLAVHPKLLVEDHD